MYNFIQSINEFFSLFIFWEYIRGFAIGNMNEFVYNVYRIASKP